MFSALPCRGEDGIGNWSQLAGPLLDPLSPRDTATDGDPTWCCFGSQGRGITEKASGSRIRPRGKVQSGELASACSLACLPRGRIRESGGSSVVSGCPGAHDNHKRGGAWKEGSCGGFARLPGSGRFKRNAREKSLGSSPGKSYEASCPPVA